MAIQINIKDDNIMFLPGDEIEGEVRWELPQAPAGFVVNVYWFTDGSVSNIVEGLELNSVDASGTLPFKFSLPVTPYSYSGNLFSISWEIEAYSVSPDERCARPFIMSPYNTAGELRSREPIYTLQSSDYGWPAVDSFGDFS